MLKVWDLELSLGFGVGVQVLVEMYLLARLDQKQFCLHATSLLNLAVLFALDLTSCTSLRPVPVGSGSFLGGGSVDYALRKDPAQFISDL